VDSNITEAAVSDGGTLRVEYPRLTRPALAAPFAVEVTSPGGFQDPILLAISRPWIESWDENAFYPSPSSETGDRDWVIYEFDPPPGDEFRVFYDARLEPARQTSIDGAVELRQGSNVLARVDLTTVVLP
jgi:hypothetical protein